jgi:phosphoketolase
VLRRLAERLIWRAALATRVLGAFIREVIAANPHTFRLMGPNETNSNRLNAVFEVTNRRRGCCATTYQNCACG